MFCLVDVSVDSLWIGKLMMKFLYKIIANVIFVLHLGVVLIVLFGWAIPDFWYVYMGTLVTTLLSDLIFGYCILSKWEFDIRRKINPRIDYDYTWATYYTYRFTNHRLSNETYRKLAIVFLVVSLIINMYLKLSCGR